MKLIIKGKKPNSLTEYKKKDSAYFDGCNKEDIRKVLLEEQGYLCAYCMARISEKDMTIEHYNSQSLINEKEALEYTNMLGVCNGNRNSGSKKTLICDAHKGNIALVVNPLSEESIKLIKYDQSDGGIFSDNLDIDRDLNETLNLNCEEAMLKINRKTALDNLKRYLSKNKQKGTWNKSFLAKILKKYEGKDRNGKFDPYCGIIIWYLNKRI